MSVQALLNQINKTKSSGNTQDRDTTVYYYPETDQSGNGSAVIRFLPGMTEDHPFFVKTFKHNFQDVGGWFIEECPTTIGQPCPACAHNQDLIRQHGGWDQAPDSVKSLYRKHKRKIVYIANVLVIEDKKNPDNQGKIFPMKFGSKIFGMIEDKAKPEFEDETPCNVFDLDTGANFSLKIRKVEGQTNYDKSSFGDSSKIKVDLSGCMDLNVYLDPTKFKSEDALEKRWNHATGVRTAPAKTATQKVDEEFEDVPRSVEREVVQSKPKAAPAKPAKDDDDDIEALMASLGE